MRWGCSRSSERAASCANLGSDQRQHHGRRRHPEHRRHRGREPRHHQQRDGSERQCQRRRLHGHRRGRRGGAEPRHHHQRDQRRHGQCRECDLRRRAQFRGRDRGQQPRHDLERDRDRCTMSRGGAFSWVGGLVGQNGLSGFIGAINSSYALGNVNVSGFSSMAGGLVGFQQQGSSIFNSQAFGDVTATANAQQNSDGSFAGGLVGQNRGQIDGTVTPTLASRCIPGAAMSCAAGAVSGRNPYDGSAGGLRRRQPACFHRQCARQRRGQRQLQRPAGRAGGRIGQWRQRRRLDGDRQRPWQRRKRRRGRFGGLESRIDRSVDVVRQRFGRP